MVIKKISIIIPCFNEVNTLPVVLDAIHHLKLNQEKEVIIVDDGSRDGTTELLQKWEAKKLDGFIFLFHQKNQGKGAAIQTALQKATGDYVIFQDADLEYHPQDIPALIEFVQKHASLAVYGSRALKKSNRYLYPHFYYGSKFLCILFNVFFRQKLTDPETCYKLIHRDLLCFLQLREKGFGIEIEISAKISQLKIPIYEIPISYSPRSFHEGKKIRTKDGIYALFLIIKHFLFDLQFGPLDRFMRYIRIQAALPHIIKKSPSSLLDVGCGRQAFLGWKLKNVLQSYVGIDSSIVEGEVHNLQFIQRDIFSGMKDLKNRNFVFDSVCALAFIEHIDHPQEFLRNCWRLLKENGEIILTTPSPKAKPLLNFLSAMKFINKKEIKDHKHYYTPQELYTLLLNSGFRECSSKRFFFRLNTLVIAKK